MMFFIGAFLLAIAFMPLENAIKFVQTLLCIVIAGSFAPALRNADRPIFIYSILITLGIIFVGDLVQLSGILGANMETWKGLVGFPQLGDVERESSLGFLGARYYGWFAEPSYHGTFTGLLTGLLAIRGRFKLAFLLAVGFYVLCPSPMLFIGFIYLVAGLKRYKTLSSKQRIIAVLGAIVVMGGAVALVFPRIEALLLGLGQMRAGGEVNTSESIRLLYPFFGLIEVMSTSPWLPVSVDCVTDGRCLPELSKFALITYYVFFGIAGSVAIFIALRMQFAIKYPSLIFLLLLASVMSGGGGFLVQPFLIIMLASLGRAWRTEDIPDSIVRRSVIRPAGF